MNELKKEYVDRKNISHTVEHSTLPNDNSIDKNAIIDALLEALGETK